MKPRNLHLISLTVLIAISCTTWIMQRNRGNVLEAEHQQAQNQIESLIEKLRATNELIARTDAEIQARSVAITERLNELARLQAERDELTRQETVLPTTELPYRWNEESETVRLGKRFITSLGLSPWTEDSGKPFQLDETMVTLLDMNPEERTHVQESVDRLIAHQRAVEFSVLEVLDQPISEKLDEVIGKTDPELLITFSLPAFPEEGQTLKDQFRANIESALGADRAEMFNTMSERRFDYELGGIGAQHRWITYTEKWEPGGFVSLGVFEGLDDRIMGTSSTGVSPKEYNRERINAQIPARWRELVNAHYHRGQLLEEGEN